MTREATRQVVTAIISAQLTPIKRQLVAMQNAVDQLGAQLDKQYARLAAIERTLTEPRWWTPRIFDQPGRIERAPTYDERMIRAQAEVMERHEHNCEQRLAQVTAQRDAAVAHSDELAARLLAVRTRLGELAATLERQ